MAAPHHAKPAVLSDQLLPLFLHHLRCRRFYASAEDGSRDPRHGEKGIYYLAHMTAIYVHELHFLSRLGTCIADDISL